MIRFTGAVLILLSFTLSGFALSGRLKNRSAFLRDFLSFLNSLALHIRYNSLDISEAVIKSFGGSDKYGFCSAISDNREKPFCNVWESCILSLPKASGLTTDDIKILIDFGKNLGTSDKEGEHSNITLYKKLIEENLGKSCEEYKARSKIYRALGFSAGAVIAIIIL